MMPLPTLNGLAGLAGLGGLALPCNEDHGCATVGSNPNPIPPVSLDPRTVTGAGLGGVAVVGIIRLGGVVDDGVTVVVLTGLLAGPNTTSGKSCSGEVRGEKSGILSSSCFVQSLSRGSGTTSGTTTGAMTGATTIGAGAAIRGAAIRIRGMGTEMLPPPPWPKPEPSEMLPPPVLVNWLAARFASETLPPPPDEVLQCPVAPVSPA